MAHMFVASIVRERLLAARIIAVSYTASTTSPYALIAAHKGTGIGFDESVLDSAIGGRAERTQLLKTVNASSPLVPLMNSITSERWMYLVSEQCLHARVIPCFGATALRIQTITGLDVLVKITEKTSMT